MKTAYTGWSWCYAHGQLPSRDKTNRRSDGSNTIIVFDWDDTILPTTWLERQHQLDSGGMRLKPCTKGKPKHHQHLNIFQQLMIITNAAPGWVEASCQQFMPALVPFVESVPLFARPVSALMSTWKLDAFAKECGGADVDSVVSLGDGPIERQACLRLRDRDIHVKSVKFKESPSVHELINEHELLHLRLKDLLNHQSDLDLRLVCNTSTQIINGRPPCSILHISKLNKMTKTKPVNPSTVVLPRIPQAGNNYYNLPPQQQQSMDK
ncbi:apicomplexan-conserved protein, putative [Perkinsus marinus ATCC 50983]|uniref:Apicomplexan-conserved protein, putative n=1 Tax=Perkinsus marinus (strain ATCC 50983 / TXsc) TaxID=423536 RepID=C5KH95_PERM5|nr:apicomplexan-conserved protein, putative [Perkinsus marinus ATCC 50983]EER15957.1 apicomplexan-conserved protein, putative [Perkinsus marinus ATCC 50983]|eukprot:XP_002784161.1 apicomplexan-conserved protein, putative [Perkinsus marinus ATCC 50983]